MDNKALIRSLKASGIRLLYGVGEFPVSYSYTRKDATPEQLEAFSKISIKEWKENQIIYRYDLIGAYEAKINEHPQKQMEKLGFHLLNSDCMPIADCWVFEVLEAIDNPPPYVQRWYKYQFTS